MSGHTRLGLAMLALPVIAFIVTFWVLDPLFVLVALGVIGFVVWLCVAMWLLGFSFDLGADDHIDSDGEAP